MQAPAVLRCRDNKLLDVVIDRIEVSLSSTILREMILEIEKITSHSNLVG